jgi:hypothetical protein
LEGDWYLSDPPYAAAVLHNVPSLSLGPGGAATFMSVPGRWSLEAGQTVMYRSNEPQPFFRMLWHGDGRGPIKFRLDARTGELDELSPARVEGGEGVMLRLRRR